MADTYAPIGQTGLTSYGGRIHEEYLRELQGPRWNRVLRQMRDTDPIIGAALFAIEMLIRQVDWDVVPASDAQADVDAAEFIESCLHDMDCTWPETLAEILSMLPHGWVWMELLYKRRQGEQADPCQSSQYTDGRVGWGGWSIRSQDTLDRWQFADGGNVSGMWQIAPPSYASTFIPVEKSLHLRTTSRKGNPEGRSVLRNTYRPWYFKQNIENVEGIGIERDLAGFPVVRIPASVINAGGATYEAWKTVATNVRRDEQEGLVIPSDRDNSGNLLYDLTLLASPSRRQFDTDAIVTRYNAQIAMTLLADFIVLGHEKVGSFALSSSKTALFSVALGAFLETICEGIEAQAFRRLLKLNGMAVENCPKLSHGDIESADLAKLGSYRESLTKSGMTIFPNPALEHYLLEQAGLPVSEEVGADQ
jgi:hypothetical protein